MTLKEKLEEATHSTWTEFGNQLVDICYSNVLDQIWDVVPTGTIVTIVKQGDGYGQVQVRVG